MRGINASTGKALEGLDHLRQSVRDILATPIGSRVMRRDYGSRLFELIDSPINAETVADIQAAVIDALVKWEPRIYVDRVMLMSATGGALVFNIYGRLAEDGQPITLEGVSVT